VKKTDILIGTLAGLLLSTDGFAQIPTADDVIARHIQALGGRGNIAALKTLTKKGTYVYNGLESAMVSYHARDAKSREEIVGLSQWATKPRSGVTVVRAVDGRRAWMAGHEDGIEPILLSEEETSDAVLIADFDGPLLDSAGGGDRIEVLAAVTDEGEDLLQLRVTRTSGAVEDVYVGSEDFLIRRRDLTAKRAAAGRGDVQRPQIVHYDDYRVVGGVRLPFSIQIDEALFSRQYHFDSMDANAALADALFSPPADVKPPPSPRR
jgi:hypothetical protein